MDEWTPPAEPQRPETFEDPAPREAREADTAADAFVPDITWRCDIPLLTSRFMWWDFVKVALLSASIMFALVALMGWIIEGEPAWLPWWLPIGAAAAMIVLFAFASLLLGNRHGARFELSEAGVSYSAEQRESRINTAVAVIGVLAGSASTAGAGLLAKSAEQAGWEWEEIHRANVYPGPRVISLRNSWRVLLRLHCPADQFDGIVAYVTDQVDRAAVARAAAQEGAPATRRPLPTRLATGAFALAMGVCSTAWMWGDETALRIGVLGAALIAIACLSWGIVRLLLAVAAVPALVWAGFDLVRSALEPFDAWDGVALTATLDPGLLMLAAASLVALLALAVWCVRTLRVPQEPGRS